MSSSEWKKFASRTHLTCAESRIRFYSRGESVREAVSAATEPAFTSGGKYGYVEFLRFIRSTKRARPKHHILYHVSVFSRASITSRSVVNLNGGFTTGHEAFPRYWVFFVVRFGGRCDCTWRSPIGCLRSGLRTELSCRPVRFTSIIVKYPAFFLPSCSNDPNMLSSRACLRWHTACAQVPGLEAVGKHRARFGEMTDLRNKFKSRNRH